MLHNTFRCPAGGLHSVYNLPLDHGPNKKSSQLRPASPRPPVRFEGSVQRHAAQFVPMFLCGLHSVYNLPLDHRCVLKVVCNAMLHNAFRCPAGGLHSVYNLPLDHRCVLKVVRNAMLHNAFNAFRCPAGGLHSVYNLPLDRDAILEALLF